MSSSEESGGAVPGNKPNGLWKSFLACVTTLCSFFNKFHLCKRVTRVHNLSGVDLLWLPHRKFTPHRKGTPLNDRRQQISPGNYMDTHFGYYKTNIPEVSINVHVSPMIENCEKENEVVLTKDEIREASEIKLFCDDKGIIRHTIDKRADFPKGFRCCFFARINKVIQTSNTDRSELPNKKEGEKKEHHVEAAAKAPGDLNLGDAQSFDPPLVDVNISQERGKLKGIRIAEPSEKALRVSIDECLNEAGTSTLQEATFDINMSQEKGKLKGIRIVEPSEGAPRVSIDDCSNEKGTYTLQEATFEQHDENAPSTKPTSLEQHEAMQMIWEQLQRMQGQIDQVQSQMEGMKQKMDASFSSRDPPP